MENGQKDNTQLSFDVFREECTHFHNDACIRVLSFASGKVIVDYENGTGTYTAGALLVTNPYEWYYCDTTAGTLIVLTLPLAVLQNAGAESCGKLNCNVPDSFAGAKREFDLVRTAVANLWRICFVEPAQLDSALAKKTMELFFLLREHFSSHTGDDIFQVSADSAKIRMGRIIEYIQAHWSEDLRVAEIAAREYLSPNYLSRLWRGQMNCTISDYISDIRLDQAEKMLHGDSTMTKVASLCGFPNLNAFNKKFLDRFGVTPKQYRANLNRKKQEAPPLPMQVDVLDLTQFLAYAEPAQSAGDPAEKRVKNQTIAIDRQMPGTPLRHNWRKLINIGYARDGLVGTVQEQLRRSQQEVGFEYVRFHGIFDDDMHVYFENYEGELQPNFIFVDLLLDFLLSIDLKPYIEFGYTPKALACQPIRALERETYYSKVNDPDRWRTLIRDFLHHVLKRYGKEAVQQWRFTAAGGELKLLGYLSPAEYYAHYASSYRAVKSVCREFQFGGFGGHASLIHETNEFQEFLEFGIQNGCVPDFFCIQNFPIQYVEKGESANPIFLKKISPVTISADIHYSTRLLEKTRTVLGQYQLEETEIWFDEWNASIWQRDMANDTCYKAAWLIKDICENYDRAEAFGYWLLTDFIEERLPQNDAAYFGGCGLFTFSGIPKAGWNAMRLLRGLGDMCLTSGDGYYVTKQDNAIQILLYQYVHYDDMYRFCNQTPISPARAYDIFHSGETRQYHIEVAGTQTCDCRIEKYVLNQDSGSSFDRWVEMGQPQNLRQNEIQYLKSTTEPAMSVLHFESDTIALEATLQAHECVMFTLTFME